LNGEKVCSIDKIILLVRSDIKSKEKTPWHALEYPHNIVVEN
jgi:hypothetical protein